MPAKEHCHLVGVAGAGMSALAQVLLAEGRRVTGSDRHCDAGRDLDVVAKLRRAGVGFLPQDGSGVAPGTAVVVVSTAIEKDNPDLAAATRHGVPVAHRAEMLARLCNPKRCVAVTGTSGKSTVTGMIGYILEQAGADPVVVNGAPALNWMDEDRVGNVRWGRSDLWVIEADESDRSLTQFRPDWAVITNVSRDHFGEQEAADLFAAFARQARSGAVDAVADASLLRGFDPEVTKEGSTFAWQGVRFELGLPGRHNAENAYLAALACERLGIPTATSAGALRGFRGIHRRLEKVGTARGVTVIDDYAHNPAKIRAAWEALAPYARRVLALWRPHGYGPLASMMEDLTETFASVVREGDNLWILPVYDAGGTADRSVNGGTLVESLRRRGAAHVEAADPAAASEAAASHAGAGDVVLVMGARDPGLSRMARDILAAVGGRHQQGGARGRGVD